MDYFTADPHFGHENVIEFSRRPHRNVDEMDEHILSMWNSRLLPGDRLYILGDFTGRRCKADEIASYVDRINLHRDNIVLILGNHDDERECRKVFKHVHKMYTYRRRSRPNRMNIVLSHYSMRTWNGLRNGTAWHLYGHWHVIGPRCPWGMSFDVGVDAKPFGDLWSYDDVAGRMATLTKEANEPAVRL